MSSQRKNKVIIIGAGLAGLTAAEEILKGNKNTEVIILQALSEPGGRTKSVQVNGAVFDLGGQWIGPPQQYTINLAKRAQCETIDQHHEGMKILQLGSNVQTYAQNVYQGIGFLGKIHLQLIKWKIDRMAKTVPLDNPRNCPNAFLWDSMTFHTWIEQNIWLENVKKILELAVRTVIGCDTNEVSFLFFLWYIHHNHGFQNMYSIQMGLQDKKLVKGAQYLSKFLAEQVTNKGGIIHYNSFVNKVQQNDQGVFIRTRTGEQYTGDYLIFAAPPPSLKYIEFQPQLSRERRFIRDKYMMGGYSKMIILYPKQYWVEKGFSGEILSDCLDDPLQETYDETRVKENGQIQPALVAFFSAAIDEEWTKDKEHCQKLVLEKLADHFKEPLMLEPIAIEMKVWNEEETIGGSPCAFTPPGVLTKIHNIRESQGRIHFSGTETATISQGYMDGAIQSGIRVSKEILNLLRGETPEKSPKVPSSRWYSQIMSHVRPNFWSKMALW